MVSNNNGQFLQNHWNLFLIFFGLFCWHHINCQQDFQFDVSTDEDLQVVFTEPVEVVFSNHTQIAQYKQEVTSCPYTDDKLMLSLVLKSNNWDDIIKSKKDRALSKLSKFFVIPKEYININNFNSRDIHEITKYALHEEINQLDNHKKLGQIEFMIGCGSKYFLSTKSIPNQISEQTGNGIINEISGLDFGGWLIWSKKVNNRVPRIKRADPVKEGSGEDDYESYYDNDDDDETMTEVPVIDKRIDEHPHRHHHGDESSDTDEVTITSTQRTTEETSIKTLTSTMETPKLAITNVEVVTQRKSEFVTPNTTENITLTTEPLMTKTIPIKPITTTESSEYDETAYDDYEDEFKTVVRTTHTQLPETTSEKITIPVAIDILPVNLSTTSTTTEKPLTTTEVIESEPVNYPPIIKNRLPKQPVTAGKPFSFIVPLETFFDPEDGTNLKLALLDKNDHPLKANSWIQFNPETREIYGLPLEDAVSKWQFKLRATDSGNEYIFEIVDITVQQHKAHRSANHEISIGIKLNEKFASNIDWQIKLIRGIVETLGDSSLSSVVVREVRHSIQDLNAATFIYTNESLPKDKCPEEKLDELFQRLTVASLSESVLPEIQVKYVTGKPIGPCLKAELPKPKIPKPTPHMTKNYPPVPRNQVDRVNASIGQLLVFKVPSDTFYDPEDNTDLKLSLLTLERAPLDPKHWLQFDAKNQEFYGIPKYGDAGQKEYLLVAEDREGLTATDALVVVVSHPIHREYNNIFELTLGMPFDEFNNSAIQRRFVERMAQLFGDATTSNIQIKAFRKIHQSDKTLVNYYNTTLLRPHHVCPHDSIEQLKRVLVHQDGSVRHRVKDAIGNEFDLTKISFTPMGACLDTEDTIHHAIVPIKPDETASSGFKDDYLLTFVLPAVIIVAMLLLASIIACVLHRRRMTGKMELGDEEERRSFRSKGIPVIFQDELDEKPEIGNKSPIILKDEKPPLLPPSYNSTNPDDHEDMDEYVPPPAVIINGRETRGKSPVTPSYRKPPPYVSP